MSSCLRCCPRQKLRMTEDFTIPSLQRSSLLSNIQKTLGSSFQYFFICCFLLKYHLRTIEGIRAGTLAVTAQLLLLLVLVETRRCCDENYLLNSSSLIANTYYTHTQTPKFKIFYNYLNFFQFGNFFCKKSEPVKTLTTNLLGGRMVYSLLVYEQGKIIMCHLRILNPTFDRPTGSCSKEGNVYRLKK